MASEKTDAVVIRMTSWSETSSIVTFWTRDFGKVSAIAKGAHRAKSPFEAALDLLALCRIVFLPKSHDALDILTEAKLLRRFRSGSIELLGLYCGYYVAELLLAMTEPGQPIKELFDLTDATLEGFDRGLSPRDLVLRFELQSLRILGMIPSFRKCAACSCPIEDPNEPPAFKRSSPTMIPFALESGGALCEDCLLGQRHIVRLKYETMETMERFAAAGWESRPLDTIPISVRGEVRGCITRYLTKILDKRLQLHSFLEDLAR